MCVYANNDEIGSFHKLNFFYIFRQKDEERKHARTRRRILAVENL